MAKPKFGRSHKLAISIKFGWLPTGVVSNGVRAISRTRPPAAVLRNRGKRQSIGSGKNKSSTFEGLRRHGDEYWCLHCNESSR